MTPQERLEALNRALRRARKAEFYRDRLPRRGLRSLDELSQIPLTTKADLRAVSPFGLLCVPWRKLYQYHETFGTTGTPVSSWYTKHDFRDNAQEIALGGVNLGPEDLLLVRFPYAISAAAHVFHEAGRLAGACVIPASSRSTVSPFPRILDLLRKLKVTVMAGLPLQALLLAETAELMGLDARTDFPDLRAICTAGEGLGPARRALLENLWGVPFFNYYGLTETGNVAADCAHRRLHVAEDYFIVELLAPDLKTPVAPGQIGYLVVTALRRRATPAIRYLTGDRARWVTEECPCGRGWSLEVRGRDEDTLVAGGRDFDVWDLEEILSHLPCRRFWAVASTGEGLRFVVEEERPGDAVSGELLRQLEAECGLPLRFDIVPRGTLYDRRQLLDVGCVGKPRYIYSENELDRGAHLRSDKT